MAYTKEQHEEILKSIMGTGEPTEELMEVIQGLRTDYDERIEMENKGVVEGEDWKGKYEKLKSDFINKFFETPSTTPEEIDDEMEKDIKRDGTEQTFDELFERKEG